MRINPEPETKKIVEVLEMVQKDWIEHFNKKKVKMISLPDVYKAKDEKILESLRKDFKESILVTSTRNVYNKDNLSTTIIHDADSKVVKQKEYEDILVPDYSGNFKDDKTTEKYLQALFDTKDSITKILDVLRKISGKETIRSWTPSQKSRANNPIRSLCLCYYDLGVFCVFGDGWCGGDSGLSHGVLSDPAKRE